MSPVNRLATLYAAISLAVVVVSSVVAPAAASPFAGGTDAWTIKGQVTVVQLNGYPTGKANYQNNLNVTVLGIVYVVLHNSAGQTVYINVGTTSPAAGTNSTAFVVIYGVPTGTYSATFFVTLASGPAMSVPTSIPVTL
jgi:hypothetical protein